MSSTKKYCDLRSVKHQLDAVQNDNPTNKETWKTVLTDVVEDMDSCELLPMEKCDLASVRLNIKDVLDKGFAIDEFKSTVSKAIDEFEECGQYYGNLGTGSKKKKDSPSLKPLNKWHLYLKECMDDPKIKFDKNKKQRSSRDMFKACSVKYSAKKLE